MKSMYTEVKIEQQGKPIVSDAMVVDESDSTVCIVLDLKSKYCNVGGISLNGECIFEVAANEDSIHLDSARESDITKIRFPEFKGWKLFAISGGRYTFNICLRKPEQ